MLQIDFKTVGVFEKNANSHGEQCFYILFDRLGQSFTF